jgi:hypothetical protein
LVRLRGRTMWTLFAASLTVLVALIVAALCEVEGKLLVGAGAFFLTGVLVGLLNRMLTEQQLASDIEDYGLSTMRLFQTIVISGIAAVLGVVLATYGLYSLDQSGVLPSGGGSETAVPKLPDVFSLDKSPGLVLIAAAFAFAPGRVLQRLDASAASLKQEIKSIEPGTEARRPSAEDRR